jgi:hypothetical protein
MSPLGGEPAVVEIEPSDLGADVERATDGVELVVGTRDLGSCWASNAGDAAGSMRVLTIGHNRSVHDGSEDLGALGESQSLETTANGVNQAQPGGLESERGLDLVVVDIVGDVLEDLVGLRTNSGFTVVGRHGSGKDSTGSSGTANR